MEIIMANGQLGVSSFDNISILCSRYSISPSLLHGFTKISVKPISRITVNRGRVKNTPISSANSSELIEIEKKFEFQPAFDEYLKAMESVKTVREKRSVEGVDEIELLGNEGEGYSEKPGLWRSNKKLNVSERANGVAEKLSGLELGEELARKDSEGKLGEELVRKDSEEIKRTSFRDRRDGVSKLGRKGVVESTRVSGPKLEYKENKKDMSNGVGYGKAEVEGGGTFEKPGLWIRQKGANNRQLGLGERGNGDTKKTGSLEFGEPLSRKGSVGRSEKDFGDRKGRVTNLAREGTRGLGHLKLDYEVNEMDFSNEMGFQEVRVAGSVKKINRRWTNGVTSNLDVTERVSKQRLDGIYKRSDVVKRVESDADVIEEGLYEKWNYTDMQQKPLNSHRRQETYTKMTLLSSNARQVTTRDSNTERANDCSGTSRWMTERQQSHGFSADSKTSESALDLTLNDWEGISRKSSQIEDGEAESWKNKNMKDLSQRSKVHKHTYDSDVSARSKRDSSYRDQRNMSETEKLYPRSPKTLVELNRDHYHTNDASSKVSPERGNTFMFRKPLKEDVNGSDMEMERAAFKSLEVFTDLRGQPRVLRMEMEERIKNLAKWLNGTDIDLPEWLFSKMIHSARIRFSDHSILRIIQILGTYGNWRRVLQVIEWLQSRERFKSYKSRFIYTAALDVLGKAKRPSEALNIFHAMRQGSSSYPDRAAYHCIAVTLGQAGYVKELFDVMDCMRSPPPTKFKTGMIEKWDPSLEPDIIVYNAVLNACARRKQWEGAFWVLQQLKQQGLHPSSTTYGLIMEVMFACEKYNLVYEFFRKVDKSTIPNSLNYKVLLNTLWKEGKTDDAVSAVKDMERRGIVGSAALYCDLARCLCSAGRCEEALMQMDKICKVANKPLVVTYTGLIHACLETGNIQNGAFIFEQMQKFCSPNLVTCNIMLKAYLEQGMFEDAKDLFQKMLDNSSHITRRIDYKHTINPDSYTFNTMLDACAAEQKWDEFKYFYQQMLCRGYNFNSKRHLRLILEACRAGKGELLEMTWKHLSKVNRVPPPSLVKERFCIKLEKNEYTEAISSISSHPINNPQLIAFSEKGWLDVLLGNVDRFQKDTIIKLMDNLNNIIAGSDRTHPVIQNLIYSCKEYIRIQSHATYEPHRVEEGYKREKKIV